MDDRELETDPKPAELLVRLATPADAEAIVALWNSAAGKPGSCWQRAKPANTSLVAFHSRTGATFYVAEQAGAVVAFHAHRIIKHYCFFMGAVGADAALKHLALAAAKDALVAGCTTNKGTMPDDPTIRERKSRDALGIYTFTPTTGNRLVAECNTEALIAALEGVLRE